MPSPFPGMDPCLEGPDMFPSLYGNLIFSIQELLQPELPEPSPHECSSNTLTPSGDTLAGSCRNRPFHPTTRSRIDNALRGTSHGHCTGCGPLPPAGKASPFLFAERRF